MRALLKRLVIGSEGHPCRQFPRREEIVVDRSQSEERYGPGTVHRNRSCIIEGGSTVDITPHRNEGVVFREK